MRVSPLFVLPLAAALASAAELPLRDWDRYEKSVRDQILPKDSLRALFPPLYRALRGTPPPGPTRDSGWVFPVQGYSLASVGKGGFRPAIRYGGSPVRGYDFFDGNRHGGHPAYDIFIRDKDRDCGANARAARSPTHLHFMVLEVGNGLPVPFDYYRLLAN